MDIAQEINKHLEWIETISSFLGKEDITKEQMDEITQHDRCALGQWLASENAQPFKDLPELAELEESHDAFHRLAGDLINAVEAGNEDEASAAQERFIAMSQQVITYLNMLQESQRGGNAR